MTDPLLTSMENWHFLYRRASIFGFNWKHLSTMSERRKEILFFFLTCSLHKLTRDYERRFVMTSKYLRGRLWVNPQWVLVKYPDCTYWTITAADGITGRKSTAHPISTFVNKLWKQFLFLAKTKHKKKTNTKNPRAIDHRVHIMDPITSKFILERKPFSV